MAEWTTVASTADIAEGEMVGGTVDGEDVLVAKLSGEYRAIGAICTHAGCNLANDGMLESDTVMCGCHGSIFDLASGEAVGPPAEEPEPVYRVRVEGDQVQLALAG
jgi:nitrite reductase/ring-hydroxylating ferredoxin subunit